MPLTARRTRPQAGVIRTTGRRRHRVAEEAQARLRGQDQARGCYVRRTRDKEGGGGEENRREEEAGKAGAQTAANAFTMSGPDKACSA